jgi:hypothetical protein
MYRFYRGEATRAFTEIGVMDETGVIWVTTPLRLALTAITQQGQFCHIPRW